jgi:catechol 2,3-dioxygenase-like lactoylglutathione lyase family enzyme
MTQATTHFSTISRVIVGVSDQDRAIEFYVGTLGFEKTSDTPFGNGDRWVEVATPEGATAIALAVPPGSTPGGAMTGISLRTGDIDAAYEHLRSEGVDVDAEVMRMGSPVPPMFFFRDPDGNTLHVAQDV